MKDRNNNPHPIILHMTGKRSGSLVGASTRHSITCKHTIDMLVNGSITLNMSLCAASGKIVRSVVQSSSNKIDFEIDTITRNVDTLIKYVDSNLSIVKSGYIVHVVSTQNQEIKFG